MKIFTSILIAAFVGASTAQAETMSCFFQVLKAKDLTLDISNDDFMKYTQVVKLKIEDGEINQDEIINGTTVVFSGFKYEFTDLYNITAMVLKDPKDSIQNALAVDMYRIYNAGPIDKNSWSPDVKAGSIGFESLDYETGQLTLSRLFVKELKASGLWGTSPFDESTLTAGYISLDEHIRFVASNKNIKPDDVVMFSKLFSCTLNK